MASAKALLGAVAGRFLFRHGEVTRVKPLSAHFVRIDVAGEELVGAPFVPGDKVQVFFSGVGMRTYTPITWSAEGATWFVGYAHGQGPGSQWVREVKVKDEVALFGPRRSIDVSGVRSPVVVLGDETSLAVAVALTRGDAGRQVTVVLEAGAPDEVKEVARSLELTAVTVVARGDVAAMSSALGAQLALGATPVFTGRAATIQALKKQHPGAGGRTKAYWAEGKRGLD
jgi:NADPH-dependent ferric siderophore reductase